MAGPYEGIDEHSWSETTEELLRKHPLSREEVLEIALRAWSSLWETKIGSDEAPLPLADLALPATVVGYFFEKLFAKVLEGRYAGQWRGGAGGEKDLVFIDNPGLSVEMKMSGQLGDKVFGNRSYGQVLQDGNSGKKDKSGYYITLNFYGRALFLVRFGWIDGGDWRAQASATGQMAGLSQAVYDGKLAVIRGDYTLDAPVQLLRGVGGKKAKSLEDRAIRTVRDVILLGKKLNDQALAQSAHDYAERFT